MGSIAARNVAKDVLESVGKGKRPILRNIIKKNGYKQNTADSPKQVTNTKSYKEVIDPVVKKLITERNRAIKAMAAKLPKAKYRDLVDAVDKTTKNIQLLTGKATTRFGISDLLDQIENE